MLEAFLLLQLPRKMILAAGTVGQPTRACPEMGACPIALSSSLAPDPSFPVQALRRAGSNFLCTYGVQRNETYVCRCKPWLLEVCH